MTSFIQFTHPVRIIAPAPSLESDEKAAEPECSICYNLLGRNFEDLTGHDYSETVQHVFHTACVKPWIDQQMNLEQPAACPICKKQVTHLNGEDVNRVEDLEQLFQQHIKNKDFMRAQEAVDQMIERDPDLLREIKDRLVIDQEGRFVLNDNTDFHFFALAINSVTRRGLITQEETDIGCLAVHRVSNFDETEVFNLLPPHGRTNRILFADAVCRGQKEEMSRLLFFVPKSDVVWAINQLLEILLRSIAGNRMNFNIDDIVDKLVVLRSYRDNINEQDSAFRLAREQLKIYSLLNIELQFFPDPDRNSFAPLLIKKLLEKNYLDERAVGALLIQAYKCKFPNEELIALLSTKPISEEDQVRVDFIKGILQEKLGMIDREVSREDLSWALPKILPPKTTFAANALTLLLNRIPADLYDRALLVATLKDPYLEGLRHLSFDRIPTKFLAKCINLTFDSVVFDDFNQDFFTLESQYIESLYKELVKKLTPGAFEKLAKSITFSRLKHFLLMKIETRI